MESKNSTDLEKLINDCLLYPHLLAKAFNNPKTSKLQPFHSDWIKNFYRPGKVNNEKYILLAHRGSYKTTALIQVGIVWHILLNPETSILYFRESSTLAEEILADVSKNLKSKIVNIIFNRLYKKDIKLITDTSNTIELESGAFIQSLGYDSSKTGKHANKIILDDITTDKDRYSAVIRKKKKLFYDEVINFKNPCKDTISIAGTKWHTDDLTEKLIKQGHKCDIYPIGSVNIPGFDEVTIDTLKSELSNSVFACNYLLKHIQDDSKEFREKTITEFVSWQNYQYKYIISNIDSAYTDNNDYTAESILGITTDNKLVLFGDCWQKDSESMFPTISNHYKQYGVQSFSSETNKDEGKVAKRLLEYLKDNGINNIQSYPYRETMNKQKKIPLYLKKYWNNILIDENTSSKYLEMITNWEEVQSSTEHDDPPDSASCILKYYEENYQFDNGIPINTNIVCDPDFKPSPFSHRFSNDSDNDLNSSMIVIPQEMNY